MEFPANKKLLAGDVGICNLKSLWRCQGSGGGGVETGGTCQTPSFVVSCEDSVRQVLFFSSSPIPLLASVLRGFALFYGVLFFFYKGVPNWFDVCEPAILPG